MSVQGRRRGESVVQRTEISPLHLPPPPRGSFVPYYTTCPSLEPISIDYLFAARTTINSRKGLFLLEIFHSVGDGMDDEPPWFSEVAPVSGHHSTYVTNTRVGLHSNERAPQTSRHFRECKDKRLNAIVT